MAERQNDPYGTTEPERQATDLRNVLIEALREPDRRVLLARSRLVHFSRGDELLSAQERVEIVTFPETLLASLVISGEDGGLVEVGVVGREGIVGLSALVGDAPPNLRVICQVPGDAYLASTADFARAFGDKRMQAILAQYTQFLLTQMAQITLCNQFHSVRQRAARWLLVAQDRLEEEVFDLTEEMLATMVGASRPAVATVGADLARSGVARFRHGVVTIRSRRRLEMISCECYWIMRDILKRQLNIAEVAE